jgi:hypothetical protein
METYEITKTENQIKIAFAPEYFFAACADATIDFDELETQPAFTILFENDKPIFDFGQPIFDESELAQLFNDAVLADLIAADVRFNNDENPY